MRVNPIAKKQLKRTGEKRESRRFNIYKPTHVYTRGKESGVAMLWERRVENGASLVEWSRAGLLVAMQQSFLTPGDYEFQRTLSLFFLSLSHSLHTKRNFVRICIFPFENKRKNSAS